MEGSEEEYVENTRRGSINRWTITNKHGWIIATCIFMFNFLLFGVILSFSILLVELQDEFNSTVTTIGYIGSVNTLSLNFMTPISCVLCEVTTHRRVAVLGVVLSFIGIMSSSLATDARILIFTFGIVFGTGTNFLYNPVIHLLSCSFPKGGCARAISFSSSGGSVGALTLSPLMFLLFSEFGWRSVFRVYSGIVLIVGLICCVPLSLPPTSATNARVELNAEMGRGDGRKGTIMKYVIILKHTEYWLFNFSVMFACCAVFFNMFYFVSLIESLPTSTRHNSSNLVTISAGAQWIGRLFCILAGDKLPVSGVVTLFVNCLIGTLVTSFLFFSKTHTGIIFYSVVSGCAAGVHWSLIFSVVLDIFGIARNAESLAYMIMFIGIASVVGPFAFGMCYDVTGNYDSSIIICIAFWGLSAIHFFATAVHQRCKSRTNRIYPDIQTEEVAVSSVSIGLGLDELN